MERVEISDVLKQSNPIMLMLAKERAALLEHYQKENIMLTEIRIDFNDSDGEWKKHYTYVMDGKEIKSDKVLTVEELKQLK